MKLTKVRRRAASSGFTLIEVMITLLILSIIMGAVFQQIRIATQRSAAEQVKLDMFQESREFVDQMGRDVRNAGFPNKHNFNNALPYSSGTSATNARGLMYVGPGDIWFEGDIDGSGTVSFVKYHLDTSTTNNCPCLRRSVVSKSTWLASGASSDNYTVEVQGVQNTGTTNWQSANPIFQYFNVDGSQLDLSGYSGWVIDGTTTTSNADFIKLARIDRIKVQLSVQAQYSDLQTGLKPIITLNSVIMVFNCNYASGNSGIGTGQGEIWNCQ